MSIKVVCACGKSYSVSDESVGKTGVCKACGEKFKITAPEEEVALEELPEANVMQQAAPVEERKMGGGWKGIIVIVCLISLATPFAPIGALVLVIGFFYMIWDVSRYW